MKYYSGLVFICAAVFWSCFLAWTGTTRSGLHFQDDHEIVSIQTELVSNNYSVLQTITSRIDRDINQTHRFRPFYFVHRVIEVSVFNINFAKLSLYNLLLVILTSWLLSQAALDFGLGLPSAFVLPFIVLLGEQSEIVWMLGPSETIGIFLLSVSMLCLAKTTRIGSRNFFFKFGYPFFLVLAALSKESFILLIPASIFLHLWLQVERQDLSWKKALQQNAIMIGLLFCFTFGSLLFIKLNVGTVGIGYAGVENKLPALSYYKAFNKYLFSNSLPIALMITHIVFIATLAIAIRKDSDLEKTVSEKVAKSMAPFLILVALIFVPQVILYTKSSLVGRYLIPISFFPAMVILVPLDYAQKLIAKMKYRFILGVFFIVTVSIYLHPNFLLAYTSAVQFTDAGRQSNGIVESIRSNVVSNKAERLLIVIDPTLIPTSEAAISLVTFTKDYLKKENPINFQFLQPARQVATPLAGFPLDLNRSLLVWGRDKTVENVNDRSTIKNVVIFPTLEDSFLSESKSWFNPADYKRIQGHNFVHYHEQQ